MADTPDLDALARRYLDLWQDQMAAMAHDPATVEALTRTFALMTQGAAAFTGLAQAAGARPDDAASSATTSASASAAGEPRHADDHNRARAADGPDSGAHGDRRAAPGAAASAAASGHAGRDLADVLCRLDALERRVADLESKCTGASASTSATDESRRGLSRKGGKARGRG